VINFGIFEKQENFLIIEVNSASTTGLLIGLSEEKNITLKKYWPEFSLSKFYRRFRRRLEKWKIIVVAEPSLALTTIIPVKLDRELELVKEPISASELENMLAQATAKVFNQCRAEASQKLGLDELDTIIIEHSVSNFKIDGHKVMSPTGFRGKHINACLELTLTTRKIFDDWKNFFGANYDKRFFFTESSKAELSALRRLKPMPINLLSLRNDSAAFFILEGDAAGSIISRGNLNWSLRLLLGVISENWQIKESVAARLYNSYLNDNISPRMKSHFDKILKPVLDLLFKQIGAAKMKGPAFMDSDLTLPVIFPKKVGKTTIHNLPDVSSLKELGFNIKPEEWPIPADQIFRRLSPFFEFYYRGKESPINSWLRRRLHWLGSISS
jgi:hypothetical protein